MHFFQVSDYSEEQFFRLTGVSRKVFGVMNEAVECARGRMGRPFKLSAPDQLLLTLSYWREYRTQFHVAGSFGVSEATVCRTIRFVEDALLADARFHLPGKKALYDGSMALELVIVDATEGRIERPKKNSAVATLVRRKVTPTKPKS